MGTASESKIQCFEYLNGHMEPKTRKMKYVKCSSFHEVTKEVAKHEWESALFQQVDLGVTTAIESSKCLYIHSFGLIVLNTHKINQ